MTGTSWQIVSSDHWPAILFVQRDCMVTVDNWNLKSVRKGIQLCILSKSLVFPRKMDF